MFLTRTVPASVPSDRHSSRPRVHVDSGEEQPSTHRGQGRRGAAGLAARVGLDVLDEDRARPAAVGLPQLPAVNPVVGSEEQRVPHHGQVFRPATDLATRVGPDVLDQDRARPAAVGLPQLPAVNPVASSEEQRVPHRGQETRLARRDARRRTRLGQCTHGFHSVGGRAGPAVGGGESGPSAGQGDRAAVAAVAARTPLAERARRRRTFARAPRARATLLFAHRRRRLTTFLPYQRVLATDGLARVVAGRPVACAPPRSRDTPPQRLHADDRSGPDGGPGPNVPATRLHGRPPRHPPTHADMDTRFTPSEPAVEIATD